MNGVGRPRVLVAGVGNIFLGDDGFGVEVIRQLREQPLPDRVDAVDYGIRGVHLAYDLLDGRYGALVLVDAIDLGEPAGTLGVIEVDLTDPQWNIGRRATDGGTADAHGMDPESSLRLVLSWGGQIGRVVVVGCQPEALAERIALSPAVTAAVTPAVRMVFAAARDEARRLASGAGSGGPANESPTDEVVAHA